MAWGASKAALSLTHIPNCPASLKSGFSTRTMCKAGAMLVDPEVPWLPLYSPFAFQGLGGLNINSPSHQQQVQRGGSSLGLGDGNQYGSSPWGGSGHLANNELEALLQVCVLLPLRVWCLGLGRHARDAGDLAPVSLVRFVEPWWLVGKVICSGPVSSAEMTARVPLFQSALS